MSEPWPDMLDLPDALHASAVQTDRSLVDVSFRCLPGAQRKGDHEENPNPILCA